jgi:ATP-dependent DNA helicase DinG
MILLPKAGQKLAQICGRLMRREDDHGDVLVLDKRLITKRYGQQLVNGTSFSEIQYS